MVNDDDIVVLVTFDEATTNLGLLAKVLLKTSLGAKRVDEFAGKFRSSYYLVARKGGGKKGGQRLLEEVALPKGKEYGQRIEFAGCVAI